jgi:pimeloyl-ACP methyl ester carboxylesterase
VEEIEIDGATIRYRLAGRGPLVVLLHSSSSHSGQWKPLIDALSGHFTLAAPDFHGYGRSDPLPSEGRPFFERDGAAVAALIRRHGGRAHMVGHSLGGTVALRLAITDPVLVASLVLIEPVQFSLLAGGDPALRLEIAEISSEVAAHLYLERPLEAARAFIDYWVGPGAFAAMDARTAGYVAATSARIGADWVGVSAHAPGQIGLADIARVEAPALVIAGERTRPAARAVAEIVAATLPAARLVSIPGAAHMAAATAPHLINPAICGFLADAPFESRKE